MTGTETEAGDRLSIDHLYNSPLLPGFPFYGSPELPVIHGMGNPKTMQERLLDSFIVAAITFFSTLAALGFPPEPAHVYVAAVSFSATFFTQWAFERGVKRHNK